MGVVIFSAIFGLELICFGARSLGGSGMLHGQIGLWAGLVLWVMGALLLSKCFGPNREFKFWQCGFRGSYAFGSCM